MTDEKVNLTIQVDKSLRDSFKTMCNSQDTDVSKEIVILCVNLSKKMDNKTYLKVRYNND